MDDLTKGACANTEELSHEKEITKAIEDKNTDRLHQILSEETFDPNLLSREEIITLLASASEEIRQIVDRKKQEVKIIEAIKDKNTDHLHQILSEETFDPKLFSRKKIITSLASASEEIKQIADHKKQEVKIIKAIHKAVKDNNIEKFHQILSGETFDPKLLYREEITTLLASASEEMRKIADSKAEEMRKIADSKAEEMRKIADSKAEEMSKIVNPKEEEEKSKIIKAIQDNDIEEFHKILSEKTFKPELLSREEITTLLASASEEIRQIAHYIKEVKPSLNPRISKKIAFKKVGPEAKDEIEKEFLALIEEIKTIQPVPSAIAKITRDYLNAIPKDNLLKMIYMLDQDGCGLIHYLLESDRNLARGLIDILYTKHHYPDYITHLFNSGTLDSYSKKGGGQLLRTLVASSLFNIYQIAMSKVLDPAMLILQRDANHQNLLLFLAARYNTDTSLDTAIESSRFTEEYFKTMKKFGLKIRENLGARKADENFILCIVALTCSHDNFKTIIENDTEQSLFMAEKDQNPLFSIFYILRQIGTTHKQAKLQDYIRIISEGKTPNSFTIKKRKAIDNAEKILILIINEMKKRKISLAEIGFGYTLPDVLKLLTSLNLREAVDTLLNNYSEDCIKIFDRKLSIELEQQYERIYKEETTGNLTTQQKERLLKNEILFLACKHNIASLIKFIIKQGANPFMRVPEERGDEEIPFIKYAIKNGFSAEFLDALLEKYEKKNQHDDTFSTTLILEALDQKKKPIAISLIKGFYKQHPVDFLLTKDFLSPDQKDVLLAAIMSDNTLIEEAIKQDNVEALRFILENNPNLDLYQIIEEVIKQENVEALRFILKKNPNLDLYQIYYLASYTFSNEELYPRPKLTDPQSNYFERIAGNDLSGPKVLPAIMAEDFVKAEDFLTKNPKWKSCLLLISLEIKKQENLLMEQLQQKKKSTVRRPQQQKDGKPKAPKKAARNTDLYKAIATHQNLEEELAVIDAAYQKAEAKEKRKKSSEPRYLLTKPNANQQKNPKKDPLTEKAASGKGREKESLEAQKEEIERREKESLEAQKEEIERRRKQLFLEAKMEAVKRKIEESARHLKTSEERAKSILWPENQQTGKQETNHDGAAAKSLNAETFADEQETNHDESADSLSTTSEAAAESADSLSTTSEAAAESFDPKTFEETTTEAINQQILQEYPDHYEALRSSYNVPTTEQAKKLDELNYFLQDLFGHFLYYYEKINGKITLKGSSLYSIFLSKEHQKSPVDRDIDLEIPVSLEAISKYLESKPESSESILSSISYLFNKDLKPQQLQELLEKVFVFKLEGAKINLYTETRSTDRYIRNINIAINIDGQKFDIVILNQDRILENETDYERKKWSSWIAEIDTPRLDIFFEGQKPVYLCEDFVTVAIENKIIDPKLSYEENVLRFLQNLENNQREILCNPHKIKVEKYKEKGLVTNPIYPIYTPPTSSQTLEGHLTTKALLLPRERRPIPIVAEGEQQPVRKVMAASAEDLPQAPKPQPTPIDTKPMAAASSQQPSHPMG